MSTELKNYLSKIDILIKKYKETLHGNDLSDKLNHLNSIKSRLNDEINSIDRYEKDSPFRLAMEKSTEERYMREINNAETYVEDIIHPPDFIESNSLLAESNLGTANLSSTSALPSSVYIDSGPTYQASLPSGAELNTMGANIHNIINNKTYIKNVSFIDGMISSIVHYTTTDEKNISDEITNRIQILYAANVNFDAKGGDDELFELFKHIDSFGEQRMLPLINLINANHSGGGTKSDAIIELVLLCLRGNAANVFCPNLLKAAISTGKQSILLNKIEADGAPRLAFYLRKHANLSVKKLLVDAFRNVDNNGAVTAGAYVYPNIIAAIIADNGPVASLNAVVTSINDDTKITTEVLGILDDKVNNAGHLMAVIGAHVLASIAELLSKGVTLHVGAIDTPDYKNFVTDVTASAGATASVLTNINTSIDKINALIACRVNGTQTLLSTGVATAAAAGNVAAYPNIIASLSDPQVLHDTLVSINAVAGLVTALSTEFKEAKVVAILSKALMNVNAAGNAAGDAKHTFPAIANNILINGVVGVRDPVLTDILATSANTTSILQSLNHVDAVNDALRAHLTIDDAKIIELTAKGIATADEVANTAIYPNIVTTVLGNNGALHRTLLAINAMDDAVITSLNNEYKTPEVVTILSRALMNVEAAGTFTAANHQFSNIADKILTTAASRTAVLTDILGDAGHTTAILDNLNFGANAALAVHLTIDDAKIIELAAKGVAVAAAAGNVAKYPNIVVAVFNNDAALHRTLLFIENVGVLVTALNTAYNTDEIKSILAKALMNITFDAKYTASTHQFPNIANNILQNTSGSRDIVLDHILTNTGRTTAVLDNLNFVNVVNAGLRVHLTIDDAKIIELALQGVITAKPNLPPPALALNEAKYPNIITAILGDAGAVYRILTAINGTPAHITAIISEFKSTEVITLLSKTFKNVDAVGGRQDTAYDFKAIVDNVITDAANSFERVITYINTDAVLTFDTLTVLNITPDNDVVRAAVIAQHVRVPVYELLFKAFKNVDNTGVRQNAAYNFQTIVDAVIADAANSLTSVLNFINIDNTRTTEMLGVLDFKSNEPQQIAIVASHATIAVQRLLLHSFVDDGAGHGTYPRIFNSICSSNNVARDAVLNILETYYDPGDPATHVYVECLFRMLTTAQLVANNVGSKTALYDRIAANAAALPKLDTVSGTKGVIAIVGGSNSSYGIELEEDEYSPLMDYPEKVGGLGGALIMGGCMAGMKSFMLIVVILLTIALLSLMYDDNKQKKIRSHQSQNYSNYPNQSIQLSYPNYPSHSNYVRDLSYQENRCV